ncbi:hypothetical protein DFH09DRAFT_1311494 [Mycena vulgaris]|nr:hypothetical protein DFH09DRAFT_1311494 [Mycena vulgaris]
MTGSVAREVVFRIQELCEHISAQITLQPSPQDGLKSAALVCHTLCNSAQPHIFRDIIINPSHLRDRLQTSPHLLRSIRSLSVLAQSAIHGPLSAIRC